MKTECSKSRFVWRTHKAGAIDRLTLQTESLPPPAPGEVQISVKAVGLNFADIFALTGLYSATPNGSFIPGLEFSGVVVAAGEQCSQFAVGDAVMGVTRFGGYCTGLNIDQAYLVRLPNDWSFAQGAAYLVQSLTAFYALTHLGNIKTGQRVLVHSAAGGVGLQAMNLVKNLGAHPVGTVRSQSKASFLRKLGFHDVMVRGKHFDRQLAENGKSFDLVLDGVGGKVQTASFNALAPMGRLIVYGAAEFTPGKNRPNYLSALWHYLFRPKYDVLDMISENKSVMAFNLIWLWDQTQKMQEVMLELGGLNLPPPWVGHRFKFSEAKQAIECLRKGNSLGKVVLEVNQ